MLTHIAYVQYLPNVKAYELQTCLRLGLIDSITYSYCRQTALHNMATWRVKSNDGSLANGAAT